MKSQACVRNIRNTFDQSRNMMEHQVGVIFDMDGVLIDSYEAHFESWKRLAAETQRQYSREEFVKGFGRTTREVLQEQWTHVELSEERLKKLGDRKEEIFREQICNDFPAMPGCRELIEELKQHGFSLAIGSSGPPDNVNLIVNQLDIGKTIDVLVTGADVTAGKPNPQVFLLAAEMLNIEPSRCVVVEDAPVGIEAARNAGMKCVGFASTGRTVEELAETDKVVSSFKELSWQSFVDIFSQSQ